MSDQHAPQPAAWGPTAAQQMSPSFWSCLVRTARGFNEFAPLLTLIGAMIGTVLIWTQVHDAKLQLRTSAVASEYTALTELNKVLIEHPEARPYFYPQLGETQPDWHDLRGDARQTVLAIADMALDFVDYQPGLSQPAKSDEAAWTTYWIDFFEQSQVTRDLLSTRCDWYDLADWSFLDELPGLCELERRAARSG